MIDSNKAAAEASGLSGVELDVATGQATLQTMTLVPAVLIVLFIVLYFWMKNLKSQTAAA
jgi:hypothetical protein